MRQDPADAVTPLCSIEGVWVGAASEESDGRKVPKGRLKVSLVQIRLRDKIVGYPRSIREVRRAHRRSLHFATLRSE
jgi:hypothetical protein